MTNPAQNNQSGESRRERNAALVYGLRLSGALLAFVLQIVLARWMGKSEYGLFAFVWSCVIILGEILSFGFYNLIQRLIQEYHVKRQFSHLRGAIWSAAGIILLTSSAIAILLIGGLWLFLANGWITSAFALPLMTGALALPAFALADYLSGICRAHGWMVRAFAPSALLRPVAIIGFLVGAAVLGAGINAEIAIIAAVAAIWLTFFLALFVTIKPLPLEEIKGARNYRIKEWMIAALPMMLVSSFELMLFNIDVLMISWFLPTAETGLYFAATKIMALVVFLNFAVGSAFNASYAKHHAAREQKELRDVVRWSASLTFYPTIIMLAVIILFKNQLLGLFGSDFASASYVIMPLSLGLLLRALVGPGERILMMTDQHYICAILYLITVITDVLLNLILIPRYGIMGAAIATAVSFALMSILLHLTIKKRLNATAFTDHPRKALLALRSLKLN